MVMVMLKALRYFCCRYCTDRRQSNIVMPLYLVKVARVRGINFGAAVRFLIVIPTHVRLLELMLASLRR